MTWVAIGVGAVSVGTAVYQNQQAKKAKKKAKRKLANLKKPEYEIPQEIKDNLTQAEARSLDGLPAAQKKEYIQNIERSQVASMEASSQRKGGLIGVQNSIQASNDTYNQLVSKDSAAREVNRDKLTSARGFMANAKLAKQADEKSDYQQELLGIQGDIGAAIQQENASIDSGMAAAIGTAGSVGTRPNDGSAKKGRQDRRTARRVRKGGNNNNQYPDSNSYGADDFGTYSV